MSRPRAKRCSITPIIWITCRFCVLWNVTATPGEIGLETHIFGETQIQASHASMKELVRLTEQA